jgi:hypothetical protein
VPLPQVQGGAKRVPVLPVPVGGKKPPPLGRVGKQPGPPDCRPGQQSVALAVGVPNLRPQVEHIAAAPKNQRKPGVCPEEAGRVLPGGKGAAP